MRIANISILEIDLILDPITSYLAQPDIAHCVLVSRDWHRLFTPHLWKHIHLSIPQPIFQPPHPRFLLRVPTRAALLRHHHHIRSFQTSVRSLIVYLLEAGCISLQHLSIHRRVNPPDHEPVPLSVIMDLVQQNPHLKSICLQDGMPGLINGDLSFLKALSTLVHLKTLDLTAIQLSLRFFLLVFKYLPRSVESLSLSFQSTRDEQEMAQSIVLGRVDWRQFKSNIGNTGATQGCFLDDDLVNGYMDTDALDNEGFQTDYASMFAAIGHSGKQPLVYFGQSLGASVRGESNLKSLTIAYSMAGFERSILFPILRRSPKLKRLRLPWVAEAYQLILMNTLEYLCNLQHLDLSALEMSDEQCARVVGAVPGGLLSLWTGGHVQVKEKSTLAILQHSVSLKSLVIESFFDTTDHSSNVFLEQCHGLKVFDAAIRVPWNSRHSGPKTGIRAFVQSDWKCLPHLIEFGVHLYLEETMTEKEMEQVYVKLGQLTRLERLAIKFSIGPRLVGSYEDGRRPRALLSPAAGEQSPNGAGSDLRSLGEAPDLSLKNPSSAVFLMRLDQGLGHMAGLKRLRSLDLHTVRHFMGRSEFEWIAQEWTALERFCGWRNRLIDLKVRDAFLELRPKVQVFES